MYYVRQFTVGVPLPRHFERFWRKLNPVILLWRAVRYREIGQMPDAPGADYGSFKKGARVIGPKIIRSKPSGQQLFYWV
jgi:hypothetical protein